MFVGSIGQLGLFANRAIGCAVTCREGQMVRWVRLKKSQKISITRATKLHTGIRTSGSNDGELEREGLGL